MNYNKFLWGGVLTLLKFNTTLILTKFCSVLIKQAKIKTYLSESILKRNYFSFINHLTNNFSTDQNARVLYFNRKHFDINENEERYQEAVINQTFFDSIEWFSFNGPQLYHNETNISEVIACKH